MSDTPDPSHILFPNDAPSTPPEWYKAQRSAAEDRLAGSGLRDKSDATAATMFSNEAPKPDQAKPSAGNEDDAAKIFKDDAGKFDDAPVTEFFSGFANSAAADGDTSRAQELNAAGEALIADAKAAGTDASDLAAALDVVRERQGNTISEITEEMLEAEMTTNLAALAQEGVTDADLNMARLFVSDLDKIAPGTIQSLAQTGAGNDPRLIHAAIREARKRGYR